MKIGSPTANYGRIAKLGVIWSFVGRGLYEIVSIPASMVVARLLTPHEFGVVAAANFFIQIAQRLTNFGFNSALMQRQDLTEAHKSSVFLANLVMGFGMWALLALSAPWLGTVFHSEDVTTVLPIAGLTFAITSMGSVSAAMLGRDLRFRDNVLVDGLYAWLMSIISVWMAWRGWGLWSLIWSQVIASAITTAVRIVVSGWWPSFTFSWPSLKEMLSFGIGLHFKRLLDSAALNVDNLVVGRMLGLSPLGYYDKAFTMMNRAVTFLSSAAPAVSFRIFAIIQDDANRFRIAYRKVLLATTFSAYPVLGLLTAVAPDLFYVLFGPQWTMAVVPFQVLCVAGMLKTLNSLVSSAAQSVGQVWGEVRRQLFYLALIMIGAGLGSRWGLTGSSLGVLAATCVMTVLMHAFLQYVTKLSWRDLIEPQIPSVVCTVGLLVLLQLLRMTISAEPMTLPGAVQYGMASTVLAALYYLAFVRFSGFSEMRSVVDEIVMDLVPALGPLVGARKEPAAK